VGSGRIRRDETRNGKARSSHRSKQGMMCPGAIGCGEMRLGVT
jgi:hypothetical protein